MSGRSFEAEQQTPSSLDRVHQYLREVTAYVLESGVPDIEGHDELGDGFLKPGVPDGIRYEGCLNIITETSVVRESGLSVTRKERRGEYHVCSDYGEDGQDVEVVYFKRPDAKDGVYTRTFTNNRIGAVIKARAARDVAQKALARAERITTEFQSKQTNRYS